MSNQWRVVAVPRCTTFTSLCRVDEDAVDDRKPQRIAALPPRSYEDNQKGLQTPSLLLCTVCGLCGVSKGVFPSPSGGTCSCARTTQHNTFFIVIFACVYCICRRWEKCVTISGWRVRYSECICLAGGKCAVYVCVCAFIDAGKSGVYNNMFAVSRLDGE